MSVSVTHIPSATDPLVRFRVEAEQSGDWVVTRCIHRDGRWWLQLGYRVARPTRELAMAAAFKAAGERRAA